ncbi:MAG: flippase-like domain-containing protein, partial [Proteobacteria bacterium]|nr:flippase-like domain-containing protein [Pseudomonadota bacterium]
MKKSAKTWLRMGISLGLLLVLLFFFVDLGQAWRAVASARWEFLVLLLAAFTLDRWLMSYKWRLLLVSQGYPAGHGEALKAYYLATFAGCFLPSTLGADAIR